LDTWSKQTQFKANSNPIKANFQKAQMNVNLTLTKDYRKYDDFAVQKNKPNSNPKQTQSNPISNPTTAKKAPINLGRAKDDGGQIEYKHEIRSTKFETNSKRDCFVTSPSANSGQSFVRSGLKAFYAQNDNSKSGFPILNRAKESSI